jgi:hypothetical protein
MEGHKNKTISLSPQAWATIYKLKGLEVRFNISAVCSRAIVEEGEKTLRRVEKALEKRLAAVKGGA